MNFEKRKFRLLLGILWLGLTACFGYQLIHLRVNFEFEQFFPQGDDELTFYQDHLEHFDYDNDFLTLTLENESGILDSSYLIRVQQALQAIRRLKSIKGVYSPITHKDWIKGPMGPTPVPLVHVNKPAKYPSDATRLKYHPIFHEMVNEQLTAVLVQIIHQHLTDPKEIEQLLQNTHQILVDHGISNYRLIGKLPAQQRFVGYLQQDFSTFTAGAIILSLVILLLIFRSFQVALMPFAIGLTSLIWLLGLMALLGQEITILGALIPPIILFVSTSDAIHLIYAYSQQSGELKSKRIIQASGQVFVPTLLTSFSTAVGFLCLLTIRTSPIIQLGLFTAIGITLAFCITYIFGPLLLTKARLKQPSILTKSFGLGILKYKKVILGVFTLMVAICLIGMLRINFNSFLLDDLPPDEPIRENFDFVDATFGGSQPWELAIWSPDSQHNLYAPKPLNEIAQITDYLQVEFGMDRIISPSTWAQYANYLQEGGTIESWHIPDHSDPKQYFKFINRMTLENKSFRVTSQDYQYGRIAGFIPQWGADMTHQKNRDLLQFLKKEIDPKVLQYQLTGTGYLIDKSNDQLSSQLFQGLLMGILVIGFTLGIYFQSLRLTIISMIPNLLPLIVIAGIIGFLGVPIKLTTSVLFAVAFGIAVDDTIHFIAAFQKNRQHKPIWNHLITLQSTGSAMVITSLILAFGFLLFTYSVFGATYYLGLFLSIGIASALVADIFLLPILLMPGKRMKQADQKRVIKP